MNKKFLWMAALAMGAGALMAAEVEVKAKASGDSPKVEAEVKRDGDKPAREYKTEARVESPVKAFNKADRLMGMEVRNRADERLGEVKDLVIDWQSGKVGYVALAVGGFLGVGEKLIAVPMNALSPSEHSATLLIMDATRGEIVDAPGFSSTNWPDPRNPNYDQTPFWRPKNRGSAAGSETGNGKLYTDATHNAKDARVEARVESDNSRTVTGRIKLIDGRTVVVDAANGRTETFNIGDTAHTSAFKSGDRVTIKYHTDNGKMVVDSLDK